MISITCGFFRVADNRIQINILVGVFVLLTEFFAHLVQLFGHRRHFIHQRIEIGSLFFGLFDLCRFFRLFGRFGFFGFLGGNVGEFLFHLVRFGFHRVGFGAELSCALLIARRLLDFRFGADILRTLAQRRRRFGAFLLLVRLNDDFAQIDDNFALVARQLVDCLARRLLRVAQPFADNLADSADDAAGHAVHLFDQLLRLRHDLLAHVAQCAKCLAQRFAEVGHILRLFLGVCLGVLRFFGFFRLRLFGRIRNVLLPAVLRVHLFEQALHVAQRSGNLCEGFLLRLALTHGILITRLRVCHHLIAEGEIIRRHFHVRKNIINQSANFLIHHFDAASIPNNSDIMLRYLRQSA